MGDEVTAGMEVSLSVGDGVTCTIDAVSLRDGDGVTCTIEV